MAKDIWESLREFTKARIGLDRTGISVNTQSLLQFRMAHAMAKDAVHAALDVELLKVEMQSLNLEFLAVHSAATDRRTYLQRPDLGRKLDDLSRALLTEMNVQPSDFVIIIADGLSALAVQQHAFKFIKIFLQKLDKALLPGPIVIAEQSRVALGDEIGSLMITQLVIMLIGERPGLSSPDSMGIYLTYAPQPGLTDESRNCISNIHGEGLSYELAADKLVFLMTESLRIKLSGVELKENVDTIGLADG